MASRVDAIRPPISEVRLKQPRGFFWGEYGGISCTAILGRKVAKCKLCWNDSMSLIHFEVHYNYVGGPPPSLWRSTVQSTLMDWNVAVICEAEQTEE